MTKATTPAKTKTAKKPKRAYSGGYSDADKKRIKAEVCERIANGEPLRAICREQGMPGWVTVYAWLDDDEDFAERFTRARLLGADAIAEEALAIADTPLMGQILTHKETGKEVRTEDMLGHRKLQVETRLKLLAKWFPQKYGERVEQHHTGGMSVVDVHLTDAQRDALDRAIDPDV